MSLWTDLFQGLQANPALRERLALAEQKYKDMEAENKRLKEQVIALTEENEALKRQIEQAPVAIAPPKETPEVMYGCYYFGGDPSKLYCPRCYEMERQKRNMANVHGLFHRCTVCRNVIHR